MKYGKAYVFSTFLIVVLLVSATVSFAQTVTYKQSDSILFLFDVSHSMGKEYKEHTKYWSEILLLSKINAEIVPLDYQMAIRKFGHKLMKASTGFYSDLEWEITEFTQTRMPIHRLILNNYRSPLGFVIGEADNELANMPGKKALVIFSDFKKGQNFGEPLKAAEILAGKYGRSLSIYTVYFGDDPEGLALAKALAGTSTGGIMYNGHDLLADAALRKDMEETIFAAVEQDSDNDGVVDRLDKCPDTPPDVKVDKDGCPLDSDNDGVPDYLDKCPDSPKNALVDKDGCQVKVVFSQYFDFDHHDVKRKYLKQIKEAADFLKKNPHIRVVIDGHTDWIGTEDYNMHLGQRRADAVRTYLVRYGVNPDRIVIESYGEGEPVESNKTNAGRSKNRRAIIRLFKK